MDSYILNIITIFTLAIAGCHATLPSEVYWKATFGSTVMPQSIQGSVGGTAQVRGSAEGRSSESSSSHSASANGPYQFSSKDESQSSSQSSSSASHSSTSNGNNQPQTSSSASGANGSQSQRSDWQSQSSSSSTSADNNQSKSSSSNGVTGKDESQSSSSNNANDKSQLQASSSSKAGADINQSKSSSSINKDQTQSSSSSGASDKSQSQTSATISLTGNQNQSASSSSSKEMGKDDLGRKSESTSSGKDHEESQPKSSSSDNATNKSQSQSSSSSTGTSNNQSQTSSSSRDTGNNQSQSSSSSSSTSKGVDQSKSSSSSSPTTGDSQSQSSSPQHASMGDSGIGSGSGSPISLPPKSSQEKGDTVEGQGSVKVQGSSQFSFTSIPQGPSRSAIEIVTQCSTGQFKASENEIDESIASLFFKEADLSVGAKMSVHFTKSENTATFIPLEIVKTILINKIRLLEILRNFNLNVNSEASHRMMETTDICQASKHVEGMGCLASLEAIVDYSAQVLGKKVRPISVKVDAKGKMEYNVVTVRKLQYSDTVACNKLIFPCAIFFCQHMPKTDMYIVTLTCAATGLQVKVPVLCYHDTSKWNPHHWIFQHLGVRPGACPICHYLGADDMAWVPQ